jgi:hypothetical protein
MNTFTPKILYREGDREYYLNPDGKLVSQQVDLFKDYRRAELLPEVAAELEKARILKRYPSDNLIDSVIAFQEEHPEKAIKYIGYRLLGTAGYLEVFGRSAETYYREQRHIKQNERMETKIGDLQQQLTDMQQLMFNLAKMMNPGRSQRSLGA